MTAPRLTGRRVLITGASSGVGRAAAESFAAEGARLALVARSGDALRALVAERGLDAVVLPADLGDRAAAEQVVRDAVEALGGLDVVVSNAAVAVFGHVLEVHADDFDRTMDVTFRGAVDLIREALPHLRATRGTIVATGSLMARQPLPTWSSYAAAKHALRGFLNSLRIEELEQNSGVHVCMVHPGAIDSPLFAQASSGTGVRPRIPPDAYHATVIAQALVECAVRPWRAEVVLGGETRMVDVLYGLARPLGERLLLVIDRWYRSGDTPAEPPGSLWEPPPHTGSSGGLPSRDSLWAPAQLGPRMAPAPSTPLRAAAILAGSAARAVRLRRRLAHRVPERPRPARSLRAQAAAAGSARPSGTP
jgi:NAD(P)-dependent dehydrogenase (short-subunit alcohol dehydrogenase family)